VVAQAVKQLRPIGLGIDGLQLDALDIGLFARTVGLGLDIQPRLPSQMPAIGASGPRWARVLTSMSDGSV
jgi:hypothetical protein